MKKGIILRLLEGTQLPSEVQTTLKALLPEHTLEYFKEKPDYQDSIRHRIESLHQAFIFLLAAYPPDPQFTPVKSNTLIAYVKECRSKCRLNKESLDELHKELEKFTAHLVDAVATAWYSSKGAVDKDAMKEAIAALNQAEQYVIMTKGRPEVATLMPMQFGNETEYVLQRDEPQSPCYKQLIDEFELIRQNNVPVTPFWFRELPEYQRAYFCNLNVSNPLALSCLVDIVDFRANWSNVIKRQALDLAADLKQIQTDSKPFPEWFNALSPHRKEMMRVLAKDPMHVDDNLNKLENVLRGKVRKKEFKNTFAMVSRLPEWYWALSQREQCFIKHAFLGMTSVEDVVSFLSSRHRTLPAPANFTVHSVFRINNEGECKMLGGKRWRASHIASREVLDESRAVQQRHVNSNFAKLTEQAQDNQSILIQTLISPIIKPDNLPKKITDAVSKFVPDSELYYLAREAVRGSPKAGVTAQTNHPYNVAKYVFATQADDSDCEAFIAKAASLALERPLLQKLLADYKTVLNSGLCSATIFDYDGRELFLSSLEQLIILNMGGFSSGTCVSGKDRKACELMHTDAMLLYYERYAVFPKFGVPSERQERINFIELVTDIYLSRHQHVLAGQNAPGSEGIKTVEEYFPADITEAINKRLAALGIETSLKNDNRLATDNEVKNISSDLVAYGLTENELLCKLMTEQIGEPGCTHLYDALFPLINEMQLFDSNIKNTRLNLGLFAVSMKSGGTTPTGIKEIKAIIDSEEAGDTNIERLAFIFLTILKRPESGSSRAMATTSVYNRIRDLVKPLKEGVNIQELVNVAIQEWTQLFEESKKTNSGNAQAKADLCYV
ncbi:MAG: oxidoreductase [Legionellales bacterium]